MRSTTLRMDTFGKEAVERYAAANGISPSAVMRDAALYYLAERESERTAWRVPRFIRERGRPRGSEKLEIGVDDPTWDAIEQEALRQGVGAALLAEHALLFFLADVEAGRLGEGDGA
ncbi:MAG: hypothetical protein ACRDL0_12405 [Thermoleophilaceae bacterium]